MSLYEGEINYHGLWLRFFIFIYRKLIFQRHYTLVQTIVVVYWKIFRIWKMQNTKKCAKIFTVYLIVFRNSQRVQIRGRRPGRWLWDCDPSSHPGKHHLDQPGPQVQHWEAGGAGDTRAEVKHFSSPDKIQYPIRQRALLKPGFTEALHNKYWDGPKDMSTTLYSVYCI